MGNHLFFLTLQIFNTVYSISSFISSEVKLNLSLLVFLTGHVSILIRVLIMIWFVFINYDSFMSLSFMLLILLAATCEYVFLWILVFMSFNLSLYTGHPAHAAYECLLNLYTSTFPCWSYFCNLCLNYYILDIFLAVYNCWQITKCITFKTFDYFLFLI